VVITQKDQESRGNLGTLIKMPNIANLLVKTEKYCKELKKSTNRKFSTKCQPTS
jgi:hypothetical protein